MVMAEKENKLQIRFSIEPSNFRSCAALLTYEPSSSHRGTWILAEVSWSEGSSVGFKETTCREVPSYIREPEFHEFDHWRRAGCTIRQIEEAAPTFERFWNAYGYKVGNKARVQKKWEKLQEGERVLAMASIARYRRFAEGKKIELVYPETYIDQRRWENEFTN